MGVMAHGQPRNLRQEGHDFYQNCRNRKSKECSEFCTKNTNNFFCEKLARQLACESGGGYMLGTCHKLNQGINLNLPSGYTLTGVPYNLQPYQSGNVVTATTVADAQNYINQGYYPTCVDCSFDQSSKKLTCGCLDRGFDSYVTNKDGIQLQPGDNSLWNNNGTLKRN